MLPQNCCFGYRVLLLMLIKGCTLTSAGTWQMQQDVIMARRISVRLAFFLSVAPLIRITFLVEELMHLGTMGIIQRV